MIAVRGAGSAIAKELRKMIPPDEDWREIDRNADMPMEADRYLFCAGVIRPKRIEAQDAAEIAESFFINAAYVIQDCERILDKNHRARICVVGSESGFSWSFDGAYAASKAAVHRYVETKRLRSPDQQLVCVAPTIIRDAGMTLSRHDLEIVDLRALTHPKGRWLTAAEVARTIKHVLYVDDGFISGTVVRMHGGAGALR